jgi:hypothetical protein
VNTGNKLDSITEDEIAYFYSDERYAILVTHKGKKIHFESNYDGNTYKIRSDSFFVSIEKLSLLCERWMKYNYFLKVRFILN